MGTQIIIAALGLVCVLHQGNSILHPLIYETSVFQKATEFCNELKGIKGSQAIYAESYNVYKRVRDVFEMNEFTTKVCGLTTLVVVEDLEYDSEDVCSKFKNQKQWVIHFVSPSAYSIVRHSLSKNFYVQDCGTNIAVSQKLEENEKSSMEPTSITLTTEELTEMTMATTEDFEATITMTQTTDGTDTTMEERPTVDPYHIYSTLTAKVPTIREHVTPPPTIATTAAETTTQDTEDIEIYSLNEWGANDMSQEKTKLFANPPNEVMIGRSLSYCENLSQCFGFLRRHQKRKDMGLWVNFLVGNGGRIFEGRGWDHESGRGNTFYIDIIVPREKMDFPKVEMDAVQKLLKYGVRIGKISKNYTMQIFKPSNVMKQEKTLLSPWKLYIDHWNNPVRRFFPFGKRKIEEERTSERPTMDTTTDPTLQETENIKIYSLKEWGADGMSHEKTKLFTKPPNEVMIGRVESNCEGLSQCIGFLKRQQKRSGFGLWVNFLVGNGGQIFEGRGWDHESGMRNTFYIDIIVPPGTTDLPKVEVDAAHELLAYGVEIGKVSKNYTLTFFKPHNVKPLTVKKLENNKRDPSKDDNPCLGQVNSNILQWIKDNQKAESTFLTTQGSDDLRIYSLKEWGADDLSKEKTHVFVRPPNAVIVGDTQSRACQNLTDCFVILKNRQKREGMGLFVNFMVGDGGKVFEGRGWDYESGIQHVFIIDVIGSNNGTDSHKIEMDAVHRLLEYGVKIGKIRKNYAIKTAEEYFNGNPFRIPTSRNDGGCLKWLSDQLEIISQKTKERMTEEKTAPAPMAKETTANECLRLYTLMEWGADDLSHEMTKVFHEPPKKVAVRKIETDTCQSLIGCILFLKNHQKREDTGLFVNFLVGNGDMIFEGHGWDHECGESNTFYIDIIGNYHGYDPPQVEMDALHKLLEYGVKNGKISHNYTMQMITPAHVNGTMHERKGHLFGYYDVQEISDDNSTDNLGYNNGFENVTEEVEPTTTELVPIATTTRNTQETGNLTIYSRHEWGAEDLSQKMTLPYLQLPNEIVIGDTESATCSSLAECAPILQGRQDLSSYGLFVNFMVGSGGMVFEGRGWDHESGRSNTFCIDVIGSYMQDYPPKSELDTIHKLLKYGVEIGKIDKDYQTYAAKDVDWFST